MYYRDTWFFTFNKQKKKLNKDLLGFTWCSITFNKVIFIKTKISGVVVYFVHHTFLLNFLNVFRNCVWWTFGKFPAALSNLRRVSLSASRQSRFWRIPEFFLLLPQTPHRTQIIMPSEITSPSHFSLLSAFGKSKDGKKDKTERRRKRNITVIALRQCTINLICTLEAILSVFNYSPSRTSKCSGTCCAYL